MGDDISFTQIAAKIRRGLYDISNDGPRRGKRVSLSSV
jgi:hypothetical protein